MEGLGQGDDDALGAADVTEPTAVIILLDVANEFGALGIKADLDVVLVSSTANMMRRMPSVFGGAIGGAALTPRACGTSTL